MERKGRIGKGRRRKKENKEEGEKKWQLGNTGGDGYVNYPVWWIFHNVHVCQVSSCSP